MLLGDGCPGSFSKQKNSDLELDFHAPLKIILVTEYEGTGKATLVRCSSVRLSSVTVLSSLSQTGLAEPDVDGGVLQGLDTSWGSLWLLCVSFWGYVHYWACTLYTSEAKEDQNGAYQGSQE